MSAALFHPEFGEKLRLAREEKKLSHADAAGKLKLSARQIEAIEAEDFAHLPGDVFVRGFVRNYARLLGMDPDQLIVPLDISAAVPETITAPSEGVIFSSPRLRRWILLPLLALTFFVTVVAIVYYWLRQGEAALVPPATEAAVAPPMSPPALPLQPVAPAPADAPASAPSDQLAPQPADVTTPTPAQTVSSPAAPPAAQTPLSPAKPATGAAATLPVAAPTQAVPTSAVKPAPSPYIPAVAPNPYLPVPPAPASSSKPVAPPAVASVNVHQLRFVPEVDAWVQVEDGTGKRMSTLVKRGTTGAFVGVPPFKVVVGEAQQVKFSYDGRPIDLTPHIGEKVARLNLE